ncbi:CybS-domain-containing protein [Morchella snyderi]|nr:CybS-domain-containing protein [Morchella snyderi]
MASAFRTSALRTAASAFKTCARPAVAAPKIAFLKPQPRIAAFHTSKSLSILPAGRQVIEGTINEPAPIPEPNAANGSYHWSFERLLSVGLIPLTVAPFALGSVSPVTDAILGASVVIHSHIGFEAVIIDYIPARKHPTARKVFMWGLKGATVLALVGLYEFETNDVGITEAVKRVWTA